jgi:hypothetical protein
MQFLSNVVITQIPILKHTLNEIVTSSPRIKLDLERVNTSNDTLQNLIKKSEQQLNSFDNKYERRPTVPHITIGKPEPLDYLSPYLQSH